MHRHFYRFGGRTWTRVMWFRCGCGEECYRDERWFWGAR